MDTRSTELSNTEHCSKPDVDAFEVFSAHGGEQYGGLTGTGSSGTWMYTAYSERSAFAQKQGERTENKHLMQRF